ncbi:MAG: TerC family protein [Planctomycetales bacterium]|nr:TerC family protein [Planctomycetales bacterium]
MIESLIALIALSMMEIVLGIDNIVFVSILTSKLPVSQQSLGRKLGLLLALFTRVMLLGCIFWVAQLVTPVVILSDFFPMDGLKSYFVHRHHVPLPHAEPAMGTLETRPSNLPDSPENFDIEAWEDFIGISWRDIILLAGGLFLIYNSVREIHHEVEDEGEHDTLDSKVSHPSLTSIVFKVGVMDIIFSLDSVITAVGMAEQLWVMILAVVIAIGAMILFANQVGDFVGRNPTIKMLALNFLLLIGVMLVAEGIGTPISKGYIYFAMAFALLVEFFNLKIRKKQSTKLEIGLS